MTNNTSELIAFPGSYKDSDVSFLLNKLSMEYTDVAEKERLIQSGECHYSEMLSQEPTPSERHLSLFHQALAEQGARLAREGVALAKGLYENTNKDKPIVLVSLVRAGVPLGVILKRTLSALGVPAVHYGVSIIRDRGIDDVAMTHIEKLHGTENIVFVDGWTGKGAITDELAKNLLGRPGYPVKPRLVVLADPGGCAWLSASPEDWLIPFGILGAPISGLVSRSIWTREGLHGCVDCTHLAEQDLSQYLVDFIDEHRQALVMDSIPPAKVTKEVVEGELRVESRAIIKSMMETYDIDNVNRIKPGIAEATRAVLRRVPDHILVRSITDPDVALLIHLAKDSGIEVTELGKALGPYRAVTIIKKVS